MTSKQVIEKILVEEYEDQCRHDKGTTIVIPNAENIFSECEGGSWQFICTACREPLAEGVVYE
jgi:hypothetical protein